MIEPFRDGVTLEDEAAVTAAREAYNALTAEEQERVTNLDVLVQAEEMIRTLKGLAEKETVRVSDKDAFLAALANENVGIIEVEGVITIGVYGTGIFGIENNTWEDQWQAVNHDVIIRGVTDDAELERLGLVVGNDATLVLEDIYLYANHKNSASSEDPLNCVEVNRGNLYVNGSTSIELGTNGSCSAAQHTVWARINSTAMPLPLREPEMSISIQPVILPENTRQYTAVWTRTAMW